MKRLEPIRSAPPEKAVIDSKRLHTANNAPSIKRILVNVNPKYKNMCYCHVNGTFRTVTARRRAARSIRRKPIVGETAGIGLRERKKLKARLGIERAALELVLERGYDGTTVEDICERAEVSKKTFFNYFPSKAAVVTGRMDDFPEADQLVAMMEANDEMCYLDVLVNMISADYTVREGDESSELRFQAFRKMPQLFFRGQRDLLNVQKAVTEAVGAFLEAHPDRRMMDDHSTNYEALVASSAVTALVRTRSMQHVFYDEPASAEDTRRMLASYLSREGAKAQR